MSVKLLAAVMYTIVRNMLRMPISVVLSGTVAAVFPSIGQHFHTPYSISLLGPSPAVWYKQADIGESAVSHPDDLHTTFINRMTHYKCCIA